ncbi:MAG: glycine zipper 2TM domain-containing protein [Caldimonas sp.]
MNIRPLSTVVGVTALALITACSTPMRRDDRVATAPGYAQPGYQQPGYQQGAYSQYGQVRSIDAVPVASRTSGGGAVLGAVIGAVLGNQVGSGSGRAVATGVGAVGGAVAGNAIEKRTRRDDEVFRVGVRFDDGSVRDFDFQRVDDLRVGDRVKWENGQLARL